MSANRLKENEGTDGASKCLIIILCHRTRVKDDEQIKVHMQLEIFRGGRNCFAGIIIGSCKYKVEERG